MRNLAPIIAYALLASTAIAATSASAQNQGPPPGAISEEMRASMAAARARFDALPDTPGTGPFAAIKEVARNLPGNTVYRPANLAAIAPGSLGVVGWGNGGCSPDGASARNHLSELASHGYVVVAAGSILSGPGVGASGDSVPGERTTPIR